MGRGRVTARRTDGGPNPMRTLVLLNPHAGGVDDADALRRRLEAESGWEVRVGDGEQSPADLAARARRRGVERVVAAGGDGTVHAVVQGLLGSSGGGGETPALGILPLGTGNDLARTLGLPRQLEEALAVLRAGAERAIDAIEMAGRELHCWVVNVAAGGFGGEVGEAIPEGSKAAWGPLAYLRAAAERLAELRPHRLELEVDGESIEIPQALNVVVANGRFAGSGAPVAPTARPDDGRLDLVVVPELPIPELVAAVARVLLGEHLEGESDILHRRATEVALRAGPPIPFSLDGEHVPAEESVTFRCRASVLRVVARRGDEAA